MRINVVKSTTEEGYDGRHLMRIEVTKASSYW